MSTISNFVKGVSLKKVWKKGENLRENRIKRKVNRLNTKYRNQEREALFKVKNDFENSNKIRGYKIGNINNKTVVSKGSVSSNNSVSYITKKGSKLTRFNYDYSLTNINRRKNQSINKYVTANKNLIDFYKKKYNWK